MGMPEGELNHRWDSLRIIHIRFCSAHDGILAAWTAVWKKPDWCPRYCSLIPGLGVKLSNDILAGPTVVCATFEH